MNTAISRVIRKLAAASKTQVAAEITASATTAAAPTRGSQIRYQVRGLALSAGSGGTRESLCLGIGGSIRSRSERFREWVGGPVAGADAAGTLRTSACPESSGTTPEVSAISRGV